MPKLNQHWEKSNIESLLVLTGENLPSHQLWVLWRIHTTWLPHVYKNLLCQQENMITASIRLFAEHCVLSLDNNPSKHPIRKVLLFSFHRWGLERSGHLDVVAQLAWWYRDVTSADSTLCVLRQCTVLTLPLYVCVKEFSAMLGIGMTVHWTYTHTHTQELSRNLFKLLAFKTLPGDTSCNVATTQDLWNAET